jgi:outer membrane protein assembly factor BamB
VLQNSRLSRALPLFTILIFPLAKLAIADDRWPQFRGPDGQGHAVQADLPVKFGLDKGVRWRTPIHGQGWSSPVVADGRIWLTTAVTDKIKSDDDKTVATNVSFFAICVDAESGKIIHDIELASTDQPEPINPLNSYASPTPVLDEGRVYCHFGNYGTWCLDASTGEPIWHEQIVVDHGVGPGSSPIVVENLLVLVCDGCDQQFVVALNKNTGKQLWKTDRPPQRDKHVEMRKSFSTPIVIDVAGQKQIIAPAAQWIAAYEPATGKEIWRADHGDGYSIGVAPVFVDGLVIFSTGFMKPHLVAVRPDGQGDVTNSHIVWRWSHGAPNKPSPVVAGGELYVVADNGVLSKLRVTDGKEIWRQRIGTEYSSSPIVCRDRIYFSSHEGILSVVQVGSEFKLLAENKLEGRLMASPAVLNDELIIRSEQALWRIGN